MTALRRAFDWTFRDRRTGEVVIGQWPNLPLWLFLGLSAAQWILPLRETPDLWLRVASGLALVWWAADEVLRGVNPWRRLLGAAVLAWSALSALQASMPSAPSL